MKRRRGSIIATVLVVLASLSVGAALRFYTLMNTGVDEIKKSISYDEQVGTLNLLVLGVDELDSVHRSDTIILARIDLDRKAAAVMSIPRDTRVSIKGQKKQQKLNHAYAYGGIDLLRDTVVNLTGVPINYYLILNYASFPKIVDAVGGVEINVARRMEYRDKAQNLHISIKPGKQHMNGETGLKYVRFRHDALGDEGRMKRQQQFAQAFLDKVLSPAIIPRIPELVELTLSEIKTDIPLKTAIQLAGHLKDIKRQNIRFFTMPGSAAYIGNVSYWIPDLQSTSTQLTPTAAQQDKMSAKDKPDVTAAPDVSKTPNASNSASAPQTAPDASEIIAAFKEPIAVLNGTGRRGFAREFTGVLEKGGIEVGYTGNARHSDFRYCLVQYPEGKSSETAKRLAQLCGIPDNLVRAAKTDYAASLILGKNNGTEVLERLKKIFASR
ncbi:MAG: LCP family protein [Pyramidobacter sp.]|nr:LCP family protein [Pyramidobacter sp.]